MLVMLIESLGNFLHRNLTLYLLLSKLNQKFRQRSKELISKKIYDYFANSEKRITFASLFVANEIIEYYELFG